MISAEPGAGPPTDCQLCPRLAAFRAANRAAFPTYFNAPVPSFGPADARLLIVGLAPGLKGANRTGRPFTGDYAGVLLYDTLAAHGFATGSYAARPDDDLRLIDCRIANAVRCVPPQNKPTPAEAATCRRFLTGELARPGLRAIVALGQIAHQTVLAALALRAAAYRFGHAAEHPLPNGHILFDSYHCSRLNTSTGVLTPAMFGAVFAAIRARLDGPARRAP